MSLDVSAGDRLTLSSEYTNTGNEPIEGAMGMLGVYFAEN
jgi:hypothetical protein